MSRAKLIKALGWRSTELEISSTRLAASDLSHSRIFQHAFNGCLGAIAEHLGPLYFFSHLDLNGNPGPMRLQGATSMSRIYISPFANIDPQPVDVTVQNALQLIQ